MGKSWASVVVGYFGKRRKNQVINYAKEETVGATFLSSKSKPGSARMRDQEEFSLALMGIMAMFCGYH